jgi:CSLREA domain-containing protein
MEATLSPSLAAAAAALLLAALPAGADTIVVTNTNDSGTGSLRWAIEQANATPGADQIRVNTAGTSVITYRPLSELPRIERDTEVFSCCVGSAQNTVIDGSSMSGGGYAGLRLGDNVKVQGVVVNNFRDGSGGAAGIRMEGTGSQLLDVYVGTDRDGLVAAGNDTGVVITGSSNKVGYDFDDDRRQVVVSGNGVGVAVLSGTGNVIQQTWIGLGATRAALPNTSHGVRIAGGSGTRIGGPSLDLRNLVAFSGGDGLVVEGPTDAGNVLLAANLIYGSAGLAIDLGGDGVTPNDAGDGDQGPNGLQNYPVLSSASWAGDRVTVGGTLSSRPSQSYRLDFFATASVDASGHGQADRFIGSTTVMTDATGQASFVVPLYGMDAEARFVGAAATDAAGNMSELSEAVEAQGALPPAGTYSVNVTDDLEQGWCQPAHCSLREAILAANLTPNGSQPTRVHFAIPGPGPHVITIDFFPPDFTEPVVVDGYTQPGSAPNTIPFGGGLDTVLQVQVDCDPDVSPGGLGFTSDSLVRGLALRRCGIAIDLGGDRNVVEGSFIGTDVDGGGATRTGAGIYVRGSFNRVGGTTPEARNLVSGNSDGVNIVPIFDGPPAQGNAVQGNLIGTTRDGGGALGNAFSGVSLAGNGDAGAQGNLIGGSEPGAGNVISGHDCPSSGASCRGIDIAGSSFHAPVTGTVVQGNYIGTDATGEHAIPNKYGIVILRPQANNNTVGGTGPGARNVISGNLWGGVALSLDTQSNMVQGNIVGPTASGASALGAGDVGIGVNGSFNVVRSNVVRGSELGLAVFAGRYNQLSRNSAGNSASLAIDLGNDGVTANDPLDADTGPNDLLNFPVLTAVVPGTTISGTMQGLPTRELMLEFFASAAPHPSGHGEAERLIGTRTVVTDAAGNATFTFTLPSAVSGGESVSATATDVTGNTSELGPARAVVEPSFRGTALAVDAGGNGLLDPGETAVVSPTWRNGSGAAVSLAGQATALGGPAGPQYTVADAQAVYGTVPNAGQASCSSTGDCYAVRVAFPSGRPQSHLDAQLDEQLSSGATRSWLLHVGGSFEDVGGQSPFLRFVETLLHRGVTAGCGAGHYCPGSSTTRQEMAVFVLTALEGIGYRPLPCAAGFEFFSDVPASSPYCRWIQELNRRAVVAGCGATTYCPTAAVTREQMAVFVLATREGAAYRPPSCTAGAELFSDVPAASPFCAWIEELARRAVVTGCAPSHYCPAAGVTREQMAVFLTVTFSLALYGP